MFHFESIEFTTTAIMKKEKSRLIQKLCEFLEVDRSDFRLQQGNVTLYGKTNENTWLPITSRIGDFPKRISQKSFVSYKLKTNLKVNRK